MSLELLLDAAKFLEQQEKEANKGKKGSLNHSPLLLPKYLFHA